MLVVLFRPVIPAGKVDHADVYTSSEGKSKGSGYVLYSSRDDAIRAIGQLSATICLPPTYLSAHPPA